MLDSYLAEIMIKDRHQGLIKEATQIRLTSRANKNHHRKYCFVKRRQRHIYPLLINMKSGKIIQY